MVSFAPVLRNDLAKYQDQSIPVAICNCQVKEVDQQYVTSEDTEYEIFISAKSSLNSIFA